MIKAIESGQAADVITARIAQKKKEHTDLEKQILIESTQHPIPSIQDVRFFLSQFKKGDINDAKYRQALVDTFINKIYLYDDKMTILYNTQDGHSDVDLDPESLSGVMLVEAAGIEPASENFSTKASPGAVCQRDSPGVRPANGPTRR